MHIRIKKSTLVMLPLMLVMILLMLFACSGAGERKGSYILDQDEQDAGENQAVDCNRARAYVRIAEKELPAGAGKAPACSSGKRKRNSVLLFLCHLSAALSEESSRGSGLRSRVSGAAGFCVEIAAAIRGNEFLNVKKWS